jgi:hypothetical protein
MKYTLYNNVYVGEPTPENDVFEAPDDVTAVAVGASEHPGLQILKQGDRVVAIKVNGVWERIDRIAFKGAPHPRRWEQLYKLASGM